MNPGDTFDVVIEIPRGSRNKYEYDHERHVIRLDRRLFSATVYPADYGFVPDTLALDGDPLDVLVLLEDPTFPGCWVEVRAVGVFWMEDEKGPDAKILCVPQHDPIYEDVHDLSELPRACSTRSSTSSTSTRCWSRRRARSLAATRVARRRTARSRRRGCGSRARRRDRRRSSSSSWLPVSTIRPSSTTTIRSAVRAVCRRWAISSVVRSRDDHAHRPLHPGLGAEVEVGRRLVEQQDRRVDEQGAGQAEQLPLPGRQRPAALGHRVEVAAAQAGDEVVRTDRARRLLHLGVGRVGPAVRDVVADGAGEQERLLGHVAEPATVRAQVEVGDGDAVDEHLRPSRRRRSAPPA